MMYTDSELVRLARLGDMGAFDLLVARYYQRIKWFARRFSPVQEDVDDILQDVLVTAYERLQQLEHPERFSGWLMAIARSECLMWKRKRYLQAPIFSLDEADSSAQLILDHISADVARESARHDEVRQRIAQALLVLTASQRKAVQLHYIAGYDYSETAMLLQVPESTVRGRLDRARAALRKELSDMRPADAKTWKLDSVALDALRWAATFAITNPDHPKLNSILLSAKGQIVSTDTHRIICCAVPALNGVSPTLIHADLGRALRDDYHSAASGRLSISKSEVRLQLSGGGDIRASLLDSRYPDWESVVPVEFKLKVRSLAGQWLSELDALARVCDSGVVGTEWTQHRRIFLIFSPHEERITLRCGGSPAANGEAIREFSVSFPADYEPGSPELITAANATYLEQAIRALGVSGDTQVELLANDAVSQIAIRSNESSVFTVTMPMQREPMPQQTPPTEASETCRAS